MIRDCFAVGAFAASVALTSPAQTGRQLHVGSPPITGATMGYSLSSPFVAGGNPYFVFWAEGHSTWSFAPNLPGVIVDGELQIDPTTARVVHAGTLASFSSATHEIRIPLDPGLVGYMWQLQAVDLAANPPTMTFSDNALSLQVAAVPDNMVPIPAGTFSMGGTAFVSEQPVHVVHVTRPFWMSRYEVTQAEYAALIGNNPSYFQPPAWPGSDARPVDSVSWYDAVAYCAALQAQESAAGRVPAGYEYRLPTEAEWEYCCRAGSTTEFAFGNVLVCSDANFNDNGAHCEPANGPYFGQPAPVGSRSANAFGLFDMHGNAWEWCLDSWTGSPNYPVGPVADPFVQVGGGRIVRGGNWITYASPCRSAFRFNGYPVEGQLTQGFRVVLAPVIGS